MVRSADPTKSFEREELLDLLLRRPTAIFANLKSLGELHPFSFVRTITLHQLLAISVGDAGVHASPAGSVQPGFAGGDVCSARHGPEECFAAVGAAFV